MYVRTDRIIKLLERYLNDVEVLIYKEISEKFRLEEKKPPKSLFLLRKTGIKLVGPGEKSQGRLKQLKIERR